MKMVSQLQHWAAGTKQTVLPWEWLCLASKNTISAEKPQLLILVANHHFWEHNNAAGKTWVLLQKPHYKLTGKKKKKKSLLRF